MSLCKTNAIENDDKSQISYLLFEINQQKFGLDVKQIKDVLSSLTVTKVPQSREEVSGVLNLRGRIVTVIDTAKILGIPSKKDEINSRQMYIVIEHNLEEYALMVNEVMDVVDLPFESYPKVPRTIEVVWRNIAEGIDPSGEEVLLILSANKIMSFLG
jgi:purine-binding chemotaxis protein CheW